MRGYLQVTNMHCAWPQQTEFAGLGWLRGSVLAGDTACMRLEGSEKSACADPMHVRLNGINES